MTPPKLAIVCGSRHCNADGVVIVCRELDTIAPEFIIEGGADGVDKAARWWAKKTGTPCATVHAQWDEFGSRAGPLRNGWMVALKPDGVIAFPGGRGTASMVRLARSAGVPVIEPCKDMKPDNQHREGGG